MNPCTYQIVSNASTDGQPVCLYVGSTTNPAQRFRRHRWAVQRSPAQLYCTMREVGSWTIEVIQEYPGISPQDLRRHEEEERRRLEPQSNIRAAYTELKGAAYGRFYRQSRPREYFNGSLRRWRDANPERVRQHRQNERQRQMERDDAVRVLTAMQSADQ